MRKQVNEISDALKQPHVDTTEQIVCQKTPSPKFDDSRHSHYK